MQKGAKQRSQTSQQIQQIVVSWRDYMEGAGAGVLPASEHRSFPGLGARPQTPRERQDFIQIRRNFDFVIREIAQPGAITFQRFRQDSHDLFQADALHLRGLRDSVLGIVEP